MKLQLKCHPNRNVTKNNISPELNCHQNWNVIETKILLKLKCHQNKNVTKTVISPELNCYQKLNVTKTQMLPKIKSPRNSNDARTWLYWRSWVKEFKNFQDVCGAKHETNKGYSIKSTGSVLSWFFLSFQWRFWPHNKSKIEK